MEVETKLKDLTNQYGEITIRLVRFGKDRYQVFGGAIQIFDGPWTSLTVWLTTYVK